MDMAQQRSAIRLFHRAFGVIPDSVLRTIGEDKKQKKRVADKNCSSLLLCR